MEQLLVKDFSLKHTVECGQMFNYISENGFYYIVSRDRVFKIKQEGNKIYFEGADRKFVTNFFRLNDNLAEIKKEICKDAHMKRIFSQFNGLRIANLDPWECTVSYICSSMSNIPKIRKNIFLLSKAFGKKILFDNREFYSFPEPGTMNNIEKIKKCGVGFRAKYILELNSRLKDKKSSEKYFELLKKQEYQIAKSELKTNKGIGNKIADCIALFSLEKLEAFPVDVWISRIINEKYDKNFKKPEEAQEFGRQYFGKYAGYAQQYLFCGRKN